MTQADVAKAVGVSKAAVSRYESDTDSPRDRTLQRIADYLDTTPAFLRYGVGGELPAMSPPRKLTDDEIAAARARVAARRTMDGTADSPPPRPPQGGGGTTGKRRRPKPR